MISLAADAHRMVSRFAPLTPRDLSARADFLALFDEDGDAPVLRASGPDHLTASCVVFDPTLSRTLLVFHRKGSFWVQPGGHIEASDASIAAAAVRELREETGIAASVPADSSAYDLDHHQLSSRFGRCASHFDIAIAAIADDGLALTVSAESDEVRWWPVDGLPPDIPRELDARIDGLRERLRADR